MAALPGMAKREGSEPCSKQALARVCPMSDHAIVHSSEESML